jgi:NDP-sugar pyrophosphorylase family protein
MDLLTSVNIRQAVICLSYPPAKIAEVFNDGSTIGKELSYLVEASPLGTAGALKNAVERLSGTTVVFNGDILTDVDLGNVIDQHKTTGAIATIVMTPVEDPARYGVVRASEDGRVVDFVEKPPAGGATSNTINAGIYLIEPEALEFIPSSRSFSFEYDFFPALLSKGAPFYAFTHTGYWADIGTPGGYRMGNLDVLSRRLRTYQPELPPMGEKIEPSAQLDGTSYIDSSCVVRANAVIKNSVIGPNCYIEEKAVVEDSVLWSSSRIGAEAQVHRSVIGKGCHIGRSAVLAEVFLGDKSLVTDYSRF